MKAVKSIKSVVRATARAALFPIRFTAVLMLRWRAPRVEAEGFVVSLWDKDGRDSAVIANLSSALQLIRATDPRRYARMLRDVRVLTLESLSSAGLFQPWAGGMFIGTAHLRSAEPAEVASTLVHESTHVRMHQLGIRPSTPEISERIERLCIREELAFLSLLGPDYSNLRNSVAQKVRSQYWSEHARFERRLTELRNAGLPGWYLRLYRTIFEPEVSDQGLPTRKPS